MSDLPLNANDVDQTLEQVQRLCRAVVDLREQVAAANPRKYALLAEGPLDQIRRLLAELDAQVVAAGSAVILDEDGS